MFRHFSFKSFFQNGAFVLAGMMLALLVLFSGGPGVMLPGVQAAERPSLPQGQTFNSAPEGQTWVVCTPISVATFYERVHVECTEIYNGVRYFAISTTSAANSARILSTMAAAQVAGRTINVLYDPQDTSGEAFGCLATDCRTIIAVGIGS